MPTAEAGGSISVTYAHIRRPRDLRVCTHLDRHPPILAGPTAAMLLPLYGCHAPRRRGQLLALFAAAYGLRPAGEGKQTAELMIHTRAPPFLTPEPILEPTLFNTLYHDSRGAVARLQQAHEPPARRPVVPPMYTNRRQYRNPVVARSLKNRSDGADIW